MNKFKIIIPFYNVEKWISTNIESIVNQSYNNFSCFYIDDMSNDNSLNILKEYSKDKRINIIENKEKKYALENIYNAIKLSEPEDEDIIVLVDGDDWLPNFFVLNKLNEEYSNNDILLTYGTYIEYPSGRVPINVTKYSDDVIKNNFFRQEVWRASHLRTFKYKLWKHIKLEDLKDKNNVFYKMAWDLAIMFPMLEMSAGKFKFINDLLYCYNLTNPINDHKVDHLLQLNLEKEIRNKKPYEKKYL